MRQGGLVFAWETTPSSALGRWSKRLFATLVFSGLFLLPFFGWLAAEPTPYVDPGGHFTFTPPDGWSTDNSEHMGPGLVAKGPADASGAEPLIHLTHEPAGIVTLEVRWQTLLGQIALRQRAGAFPRDRGAPGRGPALRAIRVPVTSVAVKSYQALIRLVLLKGRFYQMTFAGTEEDFELLYPTLTASFDSLRIGKQ